MGNFHKTMDYYFDLLKSFSDLKKRQLKLTVIDENIGYSEIVASNPEIGNQVHSTSQSIFGAADLDAFTQSQAPEAVEGEPQYGSLSKNDQGVYVTLDAEGRLRTMYWPSGKPQTREWLNWASAEARSLAGEGGGELMMEPEPIGGEMPQMVMPGTDPMMAAMGVVLTPTQKRLDQVKTSLQQTIADAPGFLRGSPETVQWQASGIEGNYGYLKVRFYGAQHSVEDRLENSYGFEIDEDGLKKKVPLSEFEKEQAIDIMGEVMSRVNKLATNRTSFTEEDADWISSHIVRDRYGVWFKDDYTLPYGLILAWSKGNQENHSNLWDNVVESYNAAWEKECESRGIEHVSTIESKNLRIGNYSGDSGSGNSTTGRLPEDLRPGLAEFLNGNRDGALVSLANALKKYQSNFNQAYEFIGGFQRDETVGTEELAETFDDLSEFAEFANLDVQNPNIQPQLLADVLGRVVRMERTGILARKPLLVESVGDFTGKGLKQDTIEHYASHEDAMAALLDNYDGISPKKAMEFISPDATIGDSIKSKRSVKGVIITGNNSSNSFTEMITNEKSQNFAFGQEVRLRLKITDRDYKQVQFMEDYISKGRSKIRKAFSRIQSRTTNADEASKMALEIVRRHMVAGSYYGNIVKATSMRDLLGNEDGLNRLANNIERTYEMNYLMERAKQDPNEITEGGRFSEAANKSRVARSLLAMKACATGTSMRDVLMSSRYYETGESFVGSQNDSHVLPWRQFIAGKIDFRREGNYGLWLGQDDGVNFTPFTKLGFSGIGKGSSRRTQLRVGHSHFHVAKTAYPFKTGPSREDIIERVLRNQQEILSLLLK